MTSCADLRVLFCAAAGARRGYGHLVRSLSFARALGVRPLLAIRGNQEARDVALGLGAEVVASPAARAIKALRPDVVIVDDPSAPHAQSRIDAARRAGALVVTIHDLGLGCAKFAILGEQYSRNQLRVGRALSGSPGGPDKARPTANTSGKHVLIALGGGPHVKTAEAIAKAIVQADPTAQVRIAAGFIAQPRTSGPRVAWVTPRHGLAPELAGADVAVVGGGVSLYEACAMGVPSVALLNSPHQREALTRRSTRLVDGQGASRAAAAVTALSQGI